MTAALFPLRAMLKSLPALFSSKIFSLYGSDLSNNAKFHPLLPFQERSILSSSFWRKILSSETTSSETWLMKGIPLPSKTTIFRVSCCSCEPSIQATANDEGCPDTANGPFAASRSTSRSAEHVIFTSVRSGMFARAVPDCFPRHSWKKHKAKTMRITHAFIGNDVPFLFWLMVSPSINTTASA